MNINVVFVLVLSFIWNNQTHHTPIAWQDHRPLTWEDFQSNPDRYSEAVASTASGITFSYSLKTANNAVVAFTYKVKADFYPHKSWYISGKENSYLLAHEQIHFDITELHARKLRKALSALSVNAENNSQLKMWHGKMEKQSEAMQQAYDEETNHSINPLEQKRWAAFIETELKKLDAYKI